MTGPLAEPELDDAQPFVGSRNERSFAADRTDGSRRLIASAARLRNFQNLCLYPADIRSRVSPR